MMIKDMASFEGNMPTINQASSTVQIRDNYMWKVPNLNRIQHNESTEITVEEDEKSLMLENSCILDVTKMEIRQKEAQSRTKRK